MAAEADTPQKISPMPTPLWWRLAIAGSVAVLGGMTYFFSERIDPAYRLQVHSAVGFLCLLGLAVCFSSNLRTVSWRCIGFGIALQLLLGLFILKWELSGLEWLGIPDGFKPGYELFRMVGEAVKKFIDFSDEGARFVFGALADPTEMSRVLGPNKAVIVAFKVLPTIIFISSFFSILYYFGVLQFIVRLMARLMMYLMGTSGAETLSASANVFMGQTEAPLIVKPYIPAMTQSEMLAMMVGGMATISGSLMAVYASLGGDPVGILATSVMAAPCGLYLSKLILPETETPVTSGKAKIAHEEEHANAIDAAAAGASDGMRLAINVAAMLIAFLALLAMINYLLAQIVTGQTLWETLRQANTGERVQSVMGLLLAFALVYSLVASILAFFRPGKRLHCFFGRETLAQRAGNVLILVIAFGVFVLAVNEILPYLPEELQLKHFFSAIFSPMAFLMGVRPEDIISVADLLGTKVAANEFVAFEKLKETYLGQMDHRSIVLVTYALTGFANFGSVGIQIGGIGAMAPNRRSDLARLGMRALFIGFLVTVINASVAGMLSSLD